MTVGLTFVQLVVAFAESLSKRGKEFDVEILTAKEGINPVTKQFIDMYPGLDEKQARAYIVHLMAILDIIVSNNDAITKSLPLAKA